MSVVQSDRGIIAVIGLPNDDPAFITRLTEQSGLTIYFQSSDTAAIDSVRLPSAQRVRSGRRVFADVGSPDSILLSHNVADAVIVDESVAAIRRRKTKSCA